MSFVTYNTEEMRNWSNNMSDNVQAYFNNISKLYLEIESFIGSGFTGGLADEFLKQFQDKKKYFIENRDIIEECANYISEHAGRIEEDEQELINQIKNDNYLG